MTTYESNYALDGPSDLSIAVGDHRIQCSSARLRTCTCLAGIVAGIVITFWMVSAGNVSGQENDAVESQITATIATAIPHVNSLDGAEIPVVDDKSKAPVTVVVFLRRDCPISNRFAPELRKIASDMEPRGVRFLMVYVDANDTEASIREHMATYEYPGTPAMDAEHRLANFTGATVTPEAVVFGKNGDIAYRGRINDLYVGFGKARPQPTQRDLYDAIAATLENRPIEVKITKAIGCYIGDLK